MSQKKNKWIQKAVEKEGGYRTQLRRLGVLKGDEKIPVTLSRKICNTEIGKTISWKGKRIKVTELLKKRACLHVTLSKLHKKKRKR